MVGPGGELAEYQGGVRTLQLPDSKGSAVLQRAVDGSLTHQLYGEFGGWEGALGASTAPFVGYLGTMQKRTERGTGVVVMGARGYDPSQGRFLQRDPVDGGSANDYDYVNGDPVNNLDLGGPTA